MFRQFGIAVALLALVPAAAQAQADGFTALDAAINADAPEDWAICTVASALLGETATDPAEKALRKNESEMLMAVTMARFMQQQGLTLDLARAKFVTILNARQPLYENGSGTDVSDRGKCILSGMVGQAGGRITDRLRAAYGALPPPMQTASAPVPAAPAPGAVPRAAEAPTAEMDFSATLGATGNFAAVSWRINPDGTLSGFYGYKAPGVVFTETAVPRVRGQGLAGIYDASGTGPAGPYTSSFEIIEKYRIDGGGATIYRIVLTLGGDRVTGTGVYIGGNSLSAVFGADMIGRFHTSEDLAGWDLYVVRDAGNTAQLSEFRFEGAQFEGSHEVLADGVRLGTAGFTRDAAGVIRIDMPDGSSVVAVCAPEGDNAC
jgi:hypothetical protein